MSWFQEIPKEEEFPIFMFSNTVDDIVLLNSFVVIETENKRIWFTRNHSEQYSNVCHLGDGRKIEIDENRLIEMRSEIMGIINHIHNKDFGMAMTRAEIIREKINKLM